MTSKAERLRQKRANRPSALRMIGANDNVETANDNDLVSVGGVTLNGSQSATFRKASADACAFLLDSDGNPRRRDNGDPIPDLARRREGTLALMELELEISQHLDGKRMKAVRREIAELEKARGFELTETQLRDKRGQEGVEYRVTRDGLSTLVSAGALNKPQKAAALRYRTDYERIDPESRLTPPTLLRDGKGGGGDGFADKVSQSWGRVRTIHLMIAGVTPSLDPDRRPNMPNLPVGHPAMRAIHALQEIAGKGRCLSDMTSSGSVKVRIREDLIRALHCAAIVYGLE